MRSKSEIRNPKSEGNPKSEIRNFRRSGVSAERRHLNGIVANAAPSRFTTALPLVSDFGFSPSPP
jgi:hypothetical protein